tara:strand:- start:308 stop:949 length:642 start_codon:yes stop_codon:yes gene_type:complete
MKTLKQLLFESGGVNQELYINDIDQQYHGVTPEMKKALFKQWDRAGHADWKMLKYFNISAGNVDAAFDNGLDVVYPILRIEWEGGIKGSAAYDDSQKWGEFMSVTNPSFEYRIIPVGYDFLFDESVNFGDSGYSCWNIMVELKPSSPNGEIVWDGLVVGEEIFDKLEYPLQDFGNYDDVEKDLLEELWERDQSGSYTLFEYFRSFCQVGVKVH